MNDQNAELVAASVQDCSPVSLTPEQVENWRRALCGILGPYALVMPVAAVQRMRDRFQQHADRNTNGQRIK